MLAAGLWLTSYACAAAAQPEPTMQLGQTALPPEGYVAFCERQPWDCGERPSLILAQASKAQAERTALLGMATPAAPAALLRPTSVSGGPLVGLAPAPEPLEASVERAEIMTRVVFVDPSDKAAEAPTAAAPPRMTRQLWSKLNRINDQVNRSVVSAPDLATYGEIDRWATPLETGVRTGDCEDFVLEKQRALLAAGLPREALNIALVTTPWGESHAVLLVDTSEGEFVLDSLNQWITPWQRASYRWRERQVNGDAFNWVMIKDSSRQPTAPVQDQPDRRLVVAVLR
jgi:predicted transglutaminase-like cysteine proteinase